jgi:predicted metal-dependent phosphoesterase TrpH
MRRKLVASFSLESNHFSARGSATGGDHRSEVHSKLSPLLAELHAHTSWSDGDLSVRELVELYGSAGFDVLCITDHEYRDDDPVIAAGARGVGPDTHTRYLAEIELEASRARRSYGLLVIPGLELSYNDVDPRRSAHAVAVGLREAVSLADGLAAALQRADAAGAALIGAHPDDDVETASRTHPTLGFASCPDGLGALVHRFELFNRSQLFPWVAATGRSSVAAGDFHRPEHLVGWKTLIPCQRDEQAVVGYLRSRRPVYLARFDDEVTRAAA